MSDLHHFPTRQAHAYVRASAYLHPDGWIEVHLETDDVPTGYAHAPGYIPKLRVSVNGGQAAYLAPTGAFEREPYYA